MRRKEGSGCRIDDMVVLLQEEQKDDETQKEWCETEFDTSEDKEGELKRKIAGLEASIEEMKEGIASLKDDIKALSDGQPNDANGNKKMQLNLNQRHKL